MTKLKAAPKHRIAKGARRIRDFTATAAVVAAASATLLFHGEYAHTLAPFLVLSVSVAVGWFNKPGSRP